MTPNSEPLAQTRTAAVLETENFIDNYRIITEWIRFADAKAAVTLTVNGVFVGLLIPTLKTYLVDKSVPHPTEWWSLLVVVLFLGWLVGVVVSAIYSFLCILPFRGIARQLALSHATHFHPVGIARQYALAELTRFSDDTEKMGMAGLKRQVLAAILIDAHLSNSKYRCVTCSIWFLAASVVLGFLYLLAIQF